MKLWCHLLHILYCYTSRDGFLLMILCWQSGLHNWYTDQLVDTSLTFTAKHTSLSATYCSERRPPDIYKRTQFHPAETELFLVSLLCKQLTTNESCLSTKWRHGCSGCEGNRLSACRCCLSESRPLQTGCSFRGAPVHKLLRLQQWSSRPLTEAASSHYSQCIVWSCPGGERACKFCCVSLPWWVLIKICLHVWDSLWRSGCVHLHTAADHCFFS